MIPIAHKYTGSSEKMDQRQHDIFSISRMGGTDRKGSRRGGGSLLAVCTGKKR